MGFLEIPMSKAAIIFATDETFAPLAKGLVLSISTQANSDEFALRMIDIGCSADTRSWMLCHNVSIMKFDRAHYLPSIARAASIKPYQDAQLCRPFLPQIFPGYPVYVWIDSDIWIQSLDTVRLYREIALQTPAKVPISPLIDASYAFNYRQASEFTGYAKTWYHDAYGPTIASTYFDRAILSSGLFAMTAGNALWGAWAREIKSIVNRSFSSHASFHLAEQTALNYLLYAQDKFVPLDAIHNYNCHVGCAKRMSDGAVRIDLPPHRSIGAIHLSWSSKMMSRYIDAGLLYDEGNYLTSEERERLRRLAHY
jgi:hypothetical protein